MRQHPVRVFLDQAVERTRQLRFHLVAAIGLENPGLRLDHLGQRPVADSLAVWQRASLPPMRQLPASLDRLEQLPYEPALADAWDTDERHELRRTLLTRALECADELLDLA